MRQLNILYPLEIAVDKVTTFDEWWDKNIELKHGKVTVKLEKGKWGLLCRGAASKGVYELVCTLRTLKIPFNSISYWLRDEYDSKDFLPVKEYVEQN